jgi:hypothetical protein
MQHKCKNIGCNGIFPRLDTLKRHEKTCKFDINKNNYDHHNNKINGNHNTVNNKGSYNTNILVLHKDKIDPFDLIEFCKDGIVSLSYEEYDEVTDPNDDPILKLIKLINFNAKKPEHHNVYCDNVKDGIGHVYENKKWQIKRMQDIINQLLNAKINDLNEIITKSGKKMDQQTLKHLTDAIKDIAGYFPYGNRKLIGKYVSMLLVNDKEMIKRTKALVEEHQLSKKILIAANEYNGDTISDHEEDIEEWLVKEINDIFQTLMQVPFDYVDDTVNNMEYFLDQDSISQIKTIIRRLRTYQLNDKDEQNSINKFKSILRQNRDKLIKTRYFDEVFNDKNFIANFYNTDFDEDSDVVEV